MKKKLNDNLVLSTLREFPYCMPYITSHFEFLETVLNLLEFS